MRAARFGGGGRRPAEHDRGPRRLRGPRQDPHRVAAPLERLARPRLLQHLDAVLHERRPPLDVQVELLVLLGPVAGAHSEAEPPLRDEIEHREVLGEPDRVVEREEHHAHADQHALRDAGDRAAEHDRRREVAVDRTRGARAARPRRNRAGRPTRTVRARPGRGRRPARRSRAHACRTSTTPRCHGALRSSSLWSLLLAAVARGAARVVDRRRGMMPRNQSTQTSIDLTVDVTDAAGLGEPLQTRATVTLPDPATLGAPPVVCFGFPGRRLQPPATSRSTCRTTRPVDGPVGRRAGTHERGWIFVSCDHLFVGESSAPSDPTQLTFGVVAAANAATVAHVVAALADGTLSDGFPPVRDPVLLGIGQSMGGCFTIVQQGRHATYDGIAALGFSAIQTVLSFPPGTPSDADAFSPRDDGLPDRHLVLPLRRRAGRHGRRGHARLPHAGTHAGVGLGDDAAERDRDGRARLRDAKTPPRSRSPSSSAWASATSSPIRAPSPRHMRSRPTSPCSCARACRTCTTSRARASRSGSGCRIGATASPVRNRSRESARRCRCTRARPRRPAGRAGHRRGSRRSSDGCC